MTTGFRDFMRRRGLAVSPLLELLPSAISLGREAVNPQTSMQDATRQAVAENPPLTPEQTDAFRLHPSRISVVPLDQRVTFQSLPVEEQERVFTQLGAPSASDVARVRLAKRVESGELPSIQTPMRRAEVAATGALAPFSPIRFAAGEAGAEIGRRYSESTGGGPVAQTVAQLAGGVLGGSPEIVKAAPVVGRAVGRAVKPGVMATGRALEEASLRAAPRAAPLPERPLPPRNPPISRSQSFVPNETTLEQELPIQRGKRALIERLRLEARKAQPESGSKFAREAAYATEMGRPARGIDPEDVEEISAFVRALPDELLERLGSSFRETRSALKSGEYDPAKALFTIFNRTAREGDPTRVVLHEVAHHLEHFVPADRLRRLERVYADQVAAAGANAGGQYRFSSFPEWFAETIADRGLRDLLGPVERSTVERVMQTVRGLGIGVADWLRGRGFADQAEVVYRDLVAGKYVKNRPLSDVRVRDLPEPDSISQAPVVEPAAPVPPSPRAPSAAPIEPQSGNRPPSQVAAGAAGGVTPPAKRPPAPPAQGQPPSAPPPVQGQPPSAPPPHAGRAGIGIERTLRQAEAQVAQDQPGTFTRLQNRMPVVGHARRRLQPALTQPKHMTAAWVGEGLARGKVSADLQLAQMGQVELLEDTFGKGTATARGQQVNVPFAGSASDRVPWTGTLYDIMQRPHLYRLSPKQKAVLNQIQRERSFSFNRVKGDFALKTKEFPAPAGGVHLPNIDVSDNALKLHDDLREAMLSGRSDERIYATAADRWGAAQAKGKSFEPETMVSRLLAANDEAMTGAAARNVFVKGVGGITREQAIRDTDPALFAQMQRLRRQLGSLRATAARLGGRQDEIIDEFLASPIEEADLNALHAGLDPTVGVDATGKQGVNFGRNQRELKLAIDGVRDQIRDLRKAWDSANLGDFVKVTDGGINRYFPSDEAKQISQLLQTTNSKFLNFLNDARATVLGGDFSPVGIQGATVWLADPVGTSQFILRGKSKFRQGSLAEAMRADPAGWNRFTSATGVNPLGGFESEFLDTREFSSGLMGRVPGIGPKWKAFNDAVYRPLIALQKDVFDRSYQGARQLAGVTEEQARAIAADDAMKIIPRSNFRRLGQSQRDASVLRGLLTSVSFLTQPVAMVNDATKAIAKMGTLRRLTPREAFAAKRVLTLVATVESVAVASHVLRAKLDDQDPQEAAINALNPDRPEFMTLALPTGGRIGIGGPFRGIARAIAPRRVNITGGLSVMMPFAGFERFARGKVAPFINVGVGALPGVNRDFFGRPVRTEDFPVNALQTMMYLLEGVTPLTGGAVLEGVRQQDSPGEVGQEVVSQFLGTNLAPEDKPGQLFLDWRKDIKRYTDIPSEDKKARAEGKPTRRSFLKANPKIEAKMFVTGDRSRIRSLSTTAAQREVVRLMKEHGVKVADLKFLKAKDYESDERRKLRNSLERSLGEPVTTPKDSGVSPARRNTGDFRVF